MSEFVIPDEPTIEPQQVIEDAPASKPENKTTSAPKTETYTDVCPYDFCTCSGTECKTCVRLENAVRRGQENAKDKQSENSQS